MPGVNFEVGIAVAEWSVEERTLWLTSDRGNGDALEWIRKEAKEQVWVPVYPEYVYNGQGLEG